VGSHDGESMDLYHGFTSVQRARSGESGMCIRCMLTSPAVNCAKPQASPHDCLGSNAAKISKSIAYVQCTPYRRLRLHPTRLSYVSSRSQSCLPLPSSDTRRVVLHAYPILIIVPKYSTDMYSNDPRATTLDTAISSCLSDCR
jgi:hypothetical protein